MALKFHFMCTLRGVSLHDVKNEVFVYVFGGDHYTLISNYKFHRKNDYIWTYFCKSVRKSATN